MTEARGPAGPPARRAPGAPCWVSLMVHEVAATQEFYGALFGWEFRAGPQQLGPCVRALLGGHEVAGIGQLPADRRLPVAWTPYLASDDVDLTAETVRLCGGTVGVGPLDAEASGRLVIGSDPSGAVFGVRQAATHLGTSPSGTPGTPAWHELLTFETASVAKFYETVFGYDEEPVVSADVDHVTLRLGDRPVAGIHGVGNTLPRDRGPHWMTYFEVADTDQAVALLVGLGGHVLRPPHDCEHGRVATVTDPEGAWFSLIQSPRWNGEEGGGRGRTGRFPRAPRWS
ncbi:VOC family protein [Streptomyces sp. NPDC050287]|uniref:VOC family protein n=1 Tax=Streptomyces sp. NPDC050287 TaxID=3365608 RepID=UPI00378C9E4B